MDAPKCRFCGAKHYSYEPHDRQGVSAGLTARVAPSHKTQAAKPRRDNSVVLAVRDQTGDAGSIAVAPALNGFDKKAYQRDYMRKRRASTK